jgi:hypothetical protein
VTRTTINRGPLELICTHSLHSLSQSSLAQVWSCSCKFGRYIFWGDSWSLSLALSSLRYAPYLLVSLGDVLEYTGGILGDVLEEVQLQLLQLSSVLVLWFWDFLSCALSLEKDALSLLSVGPSVASRIILSVKRLWCSRVAACLWLSDNIVIFSMVKRAHQIF